MLSDFPRLSALCVLCVLILSGCASMGGGQDRLAPLRLNAEAIEAYRNADQARALSLHRELVRSDSASAYAWYRLGNLEVEAGNPDAAVTAYREALARKTSFPEARHNLGMVLMRQGASLLREARPGMSGRASVRASDAYLTCLLADLSDSEALTEACNAVDD